ncbi:hypothetical protein KY320_02940 [Candidatus Woesearchaeota archaeon]|nr:hypothetical protein [Candidatus Woesearchaeota archaeon]
MSAIGYFTALLVCWLGVFAGGALAMIAPEELESGKKYHLIVQRVVLCLMAAVLVLVEFNWYFAAVALTILYLFSSTTKIRDWIAHNSEHLYWAMSIALIFSFGNTSLMLAEASLILVFSFTTATLASEAFVEQGWISVANNLLKKFFAFPLLGTILYLVSQLFYQ